MVDVRPGADDDREESERRRAAARPSRVLPADRGALQAHRHQRGRGRGRARADPREPASAAARGGAGADRRPGVRAAVRVPVQRELDPEPDPRPLSGPRLPVQHVPEQAVGEAGRRRHHVPPGPVGVPPDPSPELHRLLRRGAARDHRPGDARVEVRGAVRDRPVVHASVPHEPRVPRRAPVLHVVLGRARARLRGRRDLRRRRSEVRGRLGYRTAGTFRDALEMAKDTVGPSPSITYMHTPPLSIADVQ